jgi:outer membrane protein assembly factor BamB
VKIALANFSTRAALGLLGGSLLITSMARADDWPQWLGPQRDGVWRETGIMQKFPEGGPKLRWKTEIGAGYAGPSVAKGRVYVADRFLKEQPKGPAGAGAKGIIQGVERVVCLKESDGEILWKHEYDAPYDLAYPAGPRTTPLVHGGKVYTVGAAGNLTCLDAEKGNLIWSKDFQKDYGANTPTWGFSANPLIEGNKLICIVGGSNSVAVAFDKDTGSEIWRALSAKEPGYCPPMLWEMGGARQLIIWHPESLNSLDPETGKVYWSEPFMVKAGLTVPTPRKVDDFLFVSSFYNGSMLMRFAKDKPAATQVWRAPLNVSERKTEGLHSIISTPFIENGYVYGVCSYGQFRCLKLETGERIWETLKVSGATGENNGNNDRWCTAFIVKNGDRFFLPNEKGDLIIAKLSPKEYQEIDRAHLVEPTNRAQARSVVWSHPAFANKNIYARNDKAIYCYSLAAE